MTTMDENAEVVIEAERSVAPIDWLTVIGATTGFAVRIQFTPDYSTRRPTILEAIAAMLDAQFEMGPLIAYEVGAVIVWHESENDPVATPTHEPHMRTQ